MATIVTRSGKNAPLTSAEVDNNFNNLNTELSTKLATSSYTASDILAKIKTVDGLTSGLDADLLQGYLPNTAHNPGFSTVMLRDSNGLSSTVRINASTGFQGPILDSANGTILSNTTGAVTLTIANATLTGTLGIGSATAPTSGRVQIAQASSNIGLEIWAATSGTAVGVASQRLMNGVGNIERLGLYGTSDTVTDIKAPNTLNIWTGGASRVQLDVSGNISSSGWLSIQGMGAGQFMATAGSATTWYNTMWRNDGSACYLLSSAAATTQALAINATFNSFRPFYWNLSTGGVGIGIGGNVGETVTIGNATTPTGVTINSNALALNAPISTATGTLTLNTSVSLPTTRSLIGTDVGSIKAPGMVIQMVYVRTDALTVYPVPAAGLATAVPPYGGVYLTDNFATITPKFANSAIYVQWNPSFEMSHDSVFRLFRSVGGVDTEIGRNTVAVAGSWVGWANPGYDVDISSTPRTNHYIFMDYPNTTAAITYKFMATSAGAAATSYCQNRPFGSTGAANNENAISQTILQEIAQ